MTAETTRIDILGLVIDRVADRQRCGTLRLTGDALAWFEFDPVADAEPVSLALPSETVAAIAGMLRTAIARTEAEERAAEEPEAEPEGDDQNPYPAGTQAAAARIARRPWLSRRNAE